MEETKKCTSKKNLGYYFFLKKLYAKKKNGSGQGAALVASAAARAAGPAAGRAAAHASSPAAARAAGPAAPPAAGSPVQPRVLPPPARRPPSQAAWSRRKGKGVAPWSRRDPDGGRGKKCVQWKRRGGAQRIKPPWAPRTWMENNGPLEWIYYSRL